MKERKEEINIRKNNERHSERTNKEKLKVSKNERKN